jgi:hypothetical protein
MMLRRVIGLIACMSSIGSASAQEVIYRNTLSEQSVETRTLSIQLESVNEDVRFAVTLRNKETGLVRRHEFDGEGASDPSPFQMITTGYCGTSVLLLTVDYPWRHALPKFGRVLETLAFRESDFAFIDMAFGPLTDIALSDDSAYDPADLDMLPPIRVRCLNGQDGKPFEFFEQATK